MDVLAEQFAKMRSVSEEELLRAKNALKASIHMNLECRGIVLEDVGKRNDSPSPDQTNSRSAAQRSRRSESE